MEKIIKNKEINMIPQIGRIELFLGPMFSGKSTELTQTVRKYSYQNKKTILVNYSEENKDSTEGSIITHEQAKFQAINCKLLADKKNELFSYDVIGIDEGHFFPDLVEVSEELCNNGKIVVVSALSGDFKMNPFPNVSRLISKADKIKLMKAYCAFCHKTAGFTLRTIKNDKTLLAGSDEIYKPVCKSCFYKHNVNIDKKEDI